MYAPFRLPPLGRDKNLSFEPEIILLSDDIKELAPTWIVARFEGSREVWEPPFLKSYTFEFKGQFAAGESLENLTIYQDTLEGERMKIPSKTHVFQGPTIVEGHQSKQDPNADLCPLFPETSFLFLPLTYTMQRLECIERDLFDVYYRII